MHTLQQRKEALLLYIKYGRKGSTVIRELGYPGKKTLALWYKDLLDNGCPFISESIRKPKFSEEMRRAAVDHYLEHGRCMAVTQRALGYPASREDFAEWIDKYAPGLRASAKANRGPEGGYAERMKMAAVAAIEVGAATGKDVSSAIGASESTIAQWLRRYGSGADMTDKPHGGKRGAGDDALERRIAELEAEVRALELKKAVLEGTVELLKKDRGTDPNRLTNREKAILINSLRGEWGLRAVLDELHMPRSSYQYQTSAMARADKHADTRARIRAAFDGSGGSYGRRRLHDALSASGVVAGERLIARLMREEGLVAKASNAKKRRYSSYKGEISAHPGNRVERNFAAGLPNMLWLTDVTQFSIPAGKVYLSAMIDCFDGAVVSWTASTTPNAEMANTMLEAALASITPKERSRLLVHSDCGCHYRWPGWLSLCDRYGVSRSMSRKGCSPDNSAMEGFFGRMKVEMFYGRCWENVAVEEFMDQIGAYIDWYNEDRIKRSLGGMSPMDYRRSLGLSA